MIYFILTILQLIASLLFDHQREMAAPVIPISKGDPSSYSNTEVFVQKHLQLNWTVDFESKTISGSAKLTVEPTPDRAAEADSSKLILDTRDLNVTSAKLKSVGTPLTFAIGKAHPAFGAPLVIEIPADVRNSSFVIVIEYTTTPACSALQWLEPQLTAGKEKPYLFSQCQAIHARSLVPVQDTPAVKITYNAQVKAPEGLVVLMSAVRDESSCNCSDGARFTQSVPIPSYLLAIVVGDLVSRKIGPRSHVWSEPALIDASAFEFTDTESFIETAEKIVGPYVWGVYDLLVLPPTFPFGGMENPCLTFVTPTLLAGDKSLANVVAHEIAHSWTGNLVTNSNPDHFWLNEGHTVFLERKILGRLYGGEVYRDFCALGGWVELQETVDTLGVTNPFTALNPNLTDVDPDDAFSKVPYEKGHTLLYYLESLLGGPSVFEPWLHAYIQHFKYKSISTAQWKEFLLGFFADKPEKKAILDKVDWEAWLHSTGMPPVKPAFNTSLLDACTNLAKKWLEASGESLDGFNLEEYSALTTNQKIEFLAQLLQGPDEMVTVPKCDKMNRVYGLNKVENSEIKFRWIRVGLKAKWEDAIPRAIQMVTDQGRMKFTRPLYRDMYAWADARPKAIAAFKANRPFMHSTTASLVAKDMHIED